MNRVQQIQQRLQKKQCIDCGQGGMPDNPQTGFAEHRCVRDKQIYEAAQKQTAPHETGPERTKRLIAEGIANLERLGA